LFPPAFPQLSKHGLSGLPRVLVLCRVRYRALFDPPDSDAMSFPRKPGNIITPILFAMIQRQC
jgi:hypothetical protein